LGADHTVKVDLTHQPLCRGDLLLLCSDGLSGQVRASEIAEAAAAAADLDALCEALVGRANDTGGPDNITVVAARFDGSGLPGPGEGGGEVGHRHFAVLPTPATTQAIVADVLAGAGLDSAAERTAPLVVAPENARAADPPAPPIRDALAERRGRARLVYLALAVLAASVAAFYLWQLLSA